MTRLLIIRHGETDWNREGRVLGRTPGIHLNERGRMEAAALADALSTQGIVALYTGPLERATETANIICRRLDLPDPIIDEGLTEIDAGDWAGKTRQEVADDPAWIRSHVNPDGARIPNGEELGEAKARARAAIDRILARHPDRTIAAVTHGDIIRSVVGHYMGQPLSEVLRIIYDTASVSLIEFKGDLAKVIRCGWKIEDGKFPLQSAFGD